MSYQNRVLFISPFFAPEKSHTFRGGKLRQWKELLTDNQIDQLKKTHWKFIN